MSAAVSIEVGSPYRKGQPAHYMHHFRHFANPATVTTLIAEIKTRHNGSYLDLLPPLIAQLQDYYQRSFQAETSPSRFAVVPWVAWSSCCP